MLLDKHKQWESLAAACDEIQALFINQPVEHGALVAADGRLIVEAKGGKQTVKFLTQDLGRVTNGGFFHNHPSGSSFSIDDLKIARDYNPAFLSVFGTNPKGGEFRYTMHRPKKGWPSSREISKYYARAVEKAKDALYDKVSEGELSLSDFDQNLAHYEMINLAKMIGAKYNEVAV